MKVTMPKNYREIFTLERYDYAKQLIAEMKEDETTAKDYAEMAVNAFCNYGGRCDFCREILKVSAEVTYNGHNPFPYSQDLPGMDVWISATARTADGFLEIGCYLSDIWGLCGDDKSKWDLIEKAFITYAKVEK